MDALEKLDSGKAGVMWWPERKRGDWKLYPGL